jgi:polysaccharide export outer membrane protein
VKYFAIGALCLVLSSSFTMVTGCATSKAASFVPVAKSEPYRVGPSDHLTIHVLPDPAIELTELHVRPDGRISVELIGDVDAAGRTSDEIAAEIQQRMEKFRQSPSVSVMVVSPASTTVSVIGEVKKPASFPLDRDIRVAEMIAMAGDATELAATSRVRIVRRQGDQTALYLADLDAIRGGDGSTDVLLQKGDLVVVPAAVPVVTGYKIRRALYPVEALFRVIGSALLLGAGHF